MFRKVPVIPDETSYPDCFPSPDCISRNPNSCPVVHECNDAWYDEYWHETHDEEGNIK